MTINKNLKFFLLTSGLYTETINNRHTLVYRNKILNLPHIKNKTEIG